MFEKVIYKNIQQDSRSVLEGDLFVSIPCDRVEAHTREAIQNGASIVVAETSLCEALKNIVSPEVQWIPVPNARQAFSQIAARHFPRQPSTMVAVTGTNGKTSVVHFLKQIWQRAGCPAASFGTLGLNVPDKFQWTTQPWPIKLTTPDALTFHQNLHALAKSGISHVAFEASSHGLDQYRVHGAQIKAAAFTNLTQDHLDYHGTIESYFEAKARLFTEVLPMSGTAVLNADSPYEATLRSMVQDRRQSLLRYGRQSTDLDISGQITAIDGHRLMVDIRLMSTERKDIPLAIVGDFQLENILCAAGLALATGMTPDQIIGILPSLVSARGRMEWIAQTPKGGAVYVDYAHSPDALERALIALRPHVAPGASLSLVFGCGGNRDAGKRSQMGQIAEKHADRVILTDDNPRHEDPAFIRAQVKVGCPNAREIADRQEAISYGLEALQQGDILLIAGKGHEQGQIIGDRIVPFDDRDMVLSIVSNQAASFALNQAASL